jgi:hypothetical protein
MLSWRGATSRRLYRYLDGCAPAALLDSNGNPLLTPVVGAGVAGETLIAVNTDGSPAMSVASGGPLFMYPYVARSPWDAA